MPAPPRLGPLVAALLPGAEIERVVPLAPDAAPPASGTAGDAKAAGYGLPLLVSARLPGGGARRLVFRTQAPNEFGHDRLADRAEAVALAWATFPTLPAHVRALDAGAVLADGTLVSLRDAADFYLVTGWADGTPYADDLRRVARERRVAPLDLDRAAALARAAAGLHAARLDDPVAWRRALRDLLGHGEGIFGVADAYPADTPAAPPARLRAIEERCLGWRWRLRGRADRLRRTHGDLHPFNVLFGEGEAFTLLDASRGGKGDPADDVTALAVNYPFFALDHPGAWRGGLRALWHAFWAAYLEASGDREVLEVAPPWVAWRALVLACPRFYPDLSPAARDAVLALAERALEAGRLDLAAPEALAPLAGGPP